MGRAAHASTIVGSFGESERRAADGCADQLLPAEWFSGEMHMLERFTVGLLAMNSDWGELPPDP